MTYQIKETFNKNTNWLETPRAFLIEVVEYIKDAEVKVHEDVQGTCMHDGKDWQTMTITILVRKVNNE